MLAGYAKKPTMRLCKRCRAANPERFLNCYSCGNDLAEASPNLPRKGELTYTCAACKAFVPFRAMACPGCGKEVAFIERVWEESVCEAPLPKGWRAKPLANDTVIVRRVGLNIWCVPNIGLLLVPGLIALGIGIALYMPHGLVGKAGDTLPFLKAILWFGGLLGLLGILLPVLFAEEICAGRDFLEVRRTFWFYRFRRRIEGGYLQVKTEQRAEEGSRGNAYWVRLLQADDYGNPLLLLESKHGILWSDEDMWHNNATDELSLLAAYLAEITRWRLRDESAGRYGE